MKVQRLKISSSSSNSALWFSLLDFFKEDIRLSETLAAGDRFVTQDYTHSVKLHLNAEKAISLLDTLVSYFFVKPLDIVTFHYMFFFLSQSLSAQNK